MSPDRLDENARWARFLRMLDEWDELTQERAAQYLDLALSDPDVNVGEGASFDSWLIPE